MHTASYEFLMKLEESAGCHQTLSSWVGSGDKTIKTFTHPLKKKKQWDTYLSRDANSPLQVGFGDETIKTFAHPLKKKKNQWDTYLSRDANSPL